MTNSGQIHSKGIKYNAKLRYTEEKDRYKRHLKPEIPTTHAISLKKPNSHSLMRESDQKINFSPTIKNNRS